MPFLLFGVNIFSSIVHTENPWYDTFFKQIPAELYLFSILTFIHFTRRYLHAICTIASTEFIYNSLIYTSALNILQQSFVNYTRSTIFEMCENFTIYAWCYINTLCMCRFMLYLTILKLTFPWVLKC